LGVGIVALLAGRMARPIEHLTNTTLDIASGDLEVRPKRSSIKEIDQLGRAISNLAEELGKKLAQTESANETLEVVLGALPEGTILVGSDETIVYANPTAYMLLGSVPDVLSGLDPHTFQSAVREAKESRQLVDLVVDHGHPTRRLRAVATPFLGDSRILLIIVDVSDRERAASIRRDFVANASHELKTPVSSIISSTEALRIALDRDPAAAGKFADHIEAAARQLDRLVSDLLDLSRLERETPGSDPVRIDMVVAEQARQITSQADDSGISLTIDVEPAIVAGSLRDLSIAMRNLLENAVRYTEAGGSISASARVAGDSVVVAIADTGAGIPIRDIERVFERFYRVDNARSRETGGTGLGLAIVKHTVESHGGRVEVQSELGRGSTFTVHLPVASNGDN
jgi:signal transduction histidine kinase